MYIPMYIKRKCMCVVVLFQDSIDNVYKFFLVEQKTYKRIWKFKITYVQLRPKKKR